MLESNLNRVQEWIRAADNKVSILLAIEGILITLILSDSMLAYVKTIQQNSFTITILIGSLVFLFVSSYKATLTIVPRLSRKNMKASLLFFGSISTMELKDFDKKIKEMDEKQYINQIIEQIHISSIIASSKHHNFKDSVIALSVSLILLGAAWFTQFYPYGF